jgi:hypothetical protein
VGATGVLLVMWAVNASAIARKSVSQLIPPLSRILRESFPAKRRAPFNSLRNGAVSGRAAVICTD